MLSKKQLILCSRVETLSRLSLWLPCSVWKVLEQYRCWEGRHTRQMWKEQCWSVQNCVREVWCSAMTQTCHATLVQCYTYGPFGLGGPMWMRTAGLLLVLQCFTPLLSLSTLLALLQAGQRHAEITAPVHRHSAVVSEQQWQPLNGRPGGSVVKVDSCRVVNAAKLHTS